MPYIRASKTKVELDYTVSDQLMGKYQQMLKNWNDYLVFKMGDVGQSKNSPRVFDLLNEKSSLTQLQLIVSYEIGNEWRFEYNTQ